MKAKFDISVDAKRSLVRMTMSGFFASEDIAQFVIARDEAYKMLRCRANEHLTLVDIREMDIQAQDIVVAFQRVLADPSTASKRIAFVIARSLACMQIKRAADSRDASYFAEVDEAEHWLLHG
ncbi:MAG: hypothetical protein EOO77_43510 [Oxalobacteraceae bacterium]|nr:MAG: hypothetical protein EOO77_43510 [Oxalobacteraceae bacterium]